MAFITGQRVVAHAMRWEDAEYPIHIVGIHMDTITLPAGARISFVCVEEVKEVPGSLSEDEAMSALYAEKKVILEHAKPVMKRSDAQMYLASGYIIALDEDVISLKE